MVNFTIPSPPNPREDDKKYSDKMKPIHPPSEGFRKSMDERTPKRDKQEYIAGGSQKEKTNLFDLSSKSKPKPKQETPRSSTNELMTNEDDQSILFPETNSSGEDSKSQLNGPPSRPSGTGETHGGGKRRPQTAGATTGEEKRPQPSLIPSNANDGEGGSQSNVIPSRPGADNSGINPQGGETQDSSYNQYAIDDDRKYPKFTIDDKEIEKKQKKSREQEAEIIQRQQKSKHIGQPQGKEVLHKTKHHQHHRIEKHTAGTGSSSIKPEKLPHAKEKAPFPHQGKIIEGDEKLAEGQEEILSDKFSSPFVKEGKINTAFDVDNIFADGSPMKRGEVGQILTPQSGEEIPEDLQTPLQGVKPIEKLDQSQINVNLENRQKEMIAQEEFSEKMRRSERVDGIHTGKNEKSDSKSPLDAKNAQIEITANFGVQAAGLQTEMPPEGPRLSSQDMKELVSQLVDKIQVMQKGGETHTIVTLRHPPMLEGATVTLTTTENAKGEFNISFANLSPEAKTFLDQRLQDGSLEKSLKDSNVTVHMITTTTHEETLIPTAQPQQPQEERQQQGRERDREQQGEQQREQQREEQDKRQRNQRFGQSEEEEES